MKTYILLFITCFILSLTGNASPEGEFNKIVREYTLKPDGSCEVRYAKELKINTHVALNSLYGETFIIYNPIYQSVKINSSYTKQADGTIINTPPNAFNEVLPSSAANAPAYNHLKELVVTHTGLELGATIFLDYTVFSKPEYFQSGNLGLEPEIDDILQETSPIKEYVINVHIPVTQTFNYLLTGIAGKPEINKTEKIKHYSWKLKNIPPVIAAPYSPKNKQNVPRLTATCHSSQESVLKMLNKNLTILLNDIGEIITKELIKGCKKEIDKVIAIQKYIQEKIATCHLTLEETGYRVRTPFEVLQSAYGTEAEKAMLLYAMLHTANLSPEIVVIYPATLKKGIKGLKAISDFRIKVNIDKKPIFLSAIKYPTESIELSENREEFWMMNNKEILPLNIIPSGIPEIDYKAEINFNPQLATVSAKAMIGNLFIPVMDNWSTERYVKNMAASAGKQVTSQVTYAKDANLSFTAEQKVNPVNGYLIYQLPDISKAVKSWNMTQLNSKRGNILEIPHSIKESYEYNIHLASNMTLKTKARQIELNKPFGKLKITIQPTGNNVFIKKEIELNKVFISSTEYSDFRNMLNLWNDKNNNQLIIHYKN